MPKQSAAEETLRAVLTPLLPPGVVITHVTSHGAARLEDVNDESPLGGIPTEVSASAWSEGEDGGAAADAAAPEASSADAAPTRSLLITLGALFEPALSRFAAAKRREFSDDKVRVVARRRRGRDDVRAAVVGPVPLRDRRAGPDARAERLRAVRARSRRGRGDGDGVDELLASRVARRVVNRSGSSPPAGAGATSAAWYVLPRRSPRRGARSSRVLDSRSTRAPRAGEDGVQAAGRGATA